MNGSRCVSPPKSPDEAPITAVAAVAHLTAKGIKTHRATLYSKGLNKILVDGIHRQQEEGGGRRLNEERREYEATLDVLREQTRILDQRNRALLGEIAIMIYNARRCNVSEDDLRQPMPV